MKFFWPLYVSCFFIGTTGVYFAAPLARPHVATFLGKKTATPQSPSHLEGLAEAISDPAATLQPTTEIPPQSQPATPPDPPPSEPDDSDPPPGVHDIFVVSYGHKPEWGISIQQTSYYKLDGARLGTVSGGTFFTYKETRPSSKGAMVACKFLSGTATNLFYLIGKKDVCLFTGSPADLSPRQRTALRAYYELNGKIIQRKNELLLTSSQKNPHFPEYKDAYTAYMSHIEKGKDLLMQRDRATNAERARLELQLGEMKMSEARLKTAYDAAHQKFRIWKNQHASQVDNPENDPNVQKWTREKAPFHAIVPSLTTL